MDALFFALTSDAHKTSLFLFFFAEAPLSQNASLVATKIKNTSTTSTRNNKKIMGVLRVKGTRVTHVTLARARCFRSRNALDRTVLVRRRGTFFIAIERGNFSENEFDQISLSLSFVFRRISFCVVPVFEFRRARARFYTATLTHSRVFFLS